MKSVTLSGKKAGILFAVAILLLCLLPHQGRAQTFGLDTAVILPGVETETGGIAWGDYDNDGDQDLLLTGLIDNSNIRISAVYRNDGGIFTDINAGLTGIVGSVAWGDYDNDGDLDILLSGYTEELLVTSIYENAGGAFTDINAGLPGMIGSVAWGDYDSDGDLDILLLGYNMDGSVSHIYRNNGGTFTNINTSLPEVVAGATAGGDYDNDGDLDLVITGIMGRSVIYRNNGTNFTDIDANIPRLSNGSSAWGDYDSDGDLDLLLAGSASGTPTVRIYQNDGGIFTDINAGLLGVWLSSVAWGDYDNDGDLDILLAGATAGNTNISRIYRNDDGTFTDINAGLPGVRTNSVTWADYDNDGDLDALIAGYDGSTYITQLWENYTTTANTAPTAPTGLTSTFLGSVVVLSWDRATDAQTPQLGLGYNLCIGTTATSIAVQSPMADVTTGYRHVPVLGNKQSATSTSIRGLAPGVTYYWSVQSIDAAYAGSPFSTTGSFTLPLPFVLSTAAVLPGMTYGKAKWGDYDSDGDLDILTAGYGNSGTGAAIYRNDDGNFTDINAPLEAVSYGSTDWVDFDNDGDLDAFIIGTSNGITRYSRLYRNDDGTFTDINAGFVGLYQAASAWGDYDSDGALDVLIQGTDGTDYYSLIYRNDNGVFTDINAGLPGIYYGSAAWGDYDSDGDLDLVLTGNSGDGPLTIIYRNDNGSFIDIGAGLPEFVFGSSAWGDYDSDGDLDLVLTGTMPYFSYTTRIYRNDNGDFLDSEIPLPGLLYSSVEWGDYDNDGDLDLLLTGENEVGQFSYVFANDGGSFIDLRTGLPGVSNGSATWGDYDNDGDLDILLMGHSSDIITQVWENLTTTANTVPDAPTGLVVSMSYPAVLSWDAASDAETPQQNLSYNVRIGTTATSMAVLSPMADVTTGYRRVPALGNAQLSTSLKLNDLVPGTTYYWSVQSVDGAYAGSEFSAIDSFTYTPLFIRSASLRGLEQSSAAWGDYDNDGDLDILLTGYDGNEGKSLIYRNDGGSFTDIEAGLTGVVNGAAAWGDYDNDGDLDILLTGFDGNENRSLIYRNDGGAFTDIEAGLTGLVGGSATWGDYDNDGDPDILLTGYDGDRGRSILYRNDGGNAFTDIEAALPGISNGNAAWGDYDNDGDLDLAVAGNSDNETICAIYRNDEGIFIDIEASLPSMYNGLVTWADYDSDGNLDVMLTGYYANLITLTYIYRHEGNDIFIGAMGYGPGIMNGSVAWGDYDNDGDPDMLITGEYGIMSHFSNSSGVYRNDGEDGFNDVDIRLPEVTIGAGVWGDYDNDGDLDILISGYDNNKPVSQVWQNLTTTTNTVPTAPTNLAVSLIDPTTVSLSWDRATDNETPQLGLTYNVWIGTTATTVGTQSPMADVTTGYRRVADLGNKQMTASTLITGLDPTTTYYWGVQAIDGAYAGSAFSATGIIQFNTAPVVSTSNTTISMLEDIPLVLAVEFTDDRNLAELAVTVTSSNQSLIPNGNIVQQGTTTATTYFVVTPVPNGNGGPVTITVQAMDAGGLSSSTTFTVTVNAVNDAPVFSTGANVVVNEDHSGYNTAFVTGSDDGDPEVTQTLTFVVSNNNPSLFTVQPSVHPSGFLSFLPAPNEHGSAVVTMYITDDGGTENGGVSTSATQTFTITVNAVNDAPVFNTGANVTVNEDSGAYSAVFATGIDDSDPETVQALTFTVNNTNNALFSVQPSVNSTTGVLSFTPAANANGTAVISLYLADNGSTVNGGVNTSATQTFTITVNPVNDAPVFSTGTNVVVNEDSGVYSAAFATGIDDGDPEAMQALTFVVSNDNPALFSIQPSISSIGSLSFEPASDMYGTAVVSVYIDDDGGIANGGVSTSATQTFQITVNSVNDAPSFVMGANVFARDEDGPQTKANYLTSISAEPADESLQAVQFIVSNNNTALFSAQPSISTNGTLTFTPAQWAQGTAVVSVYAMDNGDTANGGMNTSATQTFVITIGLSPVTQLSVASVTPVPAQSGEIVDIVVESRTTLGTLRATTATTIALLRDGTYLPLLSGSTQATLDAGTSTATIAVVFYSSSTANITTPITIMDANGILPSTTSSITINHAVPSALSAATDNGQVSLEWIPPVAMNVTDYVVFRGTSADALVEIGTTATTSYVDNTAVNGTMYFYAVKSASGNLRSGMSNSVTATIPLLTITSPNGGEKWQVGTTHNITWNTLGTIATVGVEYSLNNGGSWIVLSASTPNTGSYNWFIQNPSTTTALVRVYDIVHPAGMDISNSVFEIAPIASVTNLTATALVDGAQVSWTFSTASNVTSYELYHGMTSGSLTLLTTLAATTSSYAHTGLTDGLSHYYTVKTVVNGQYSDQSPIVSVVPSTLRVLFPNGGEVFQPGSKQVVQWQYSGDVSAMTVEYSTDNGANWTAISQTVTAEGNKPLVTFYQEWTIPNTPTTEALVRIVSTYPVEFSDASDAVFSISTLAPPTNLVAIENISSVVLSWTSSTANTVTGYRILRGVTTSSMTMLADVGVVVSYEDNTAATCMEYYYMIQTRSGNVVSGNSNVSSATVMIPASLEVIAPNGGEVWQAGTTKLITWTTTGCSVPATVLLEYSTDNGENWNIIATTANTGIYSWTVANTTATQTRVRISSGALHDESNALFAIIPVAAPSNLTAIAGVEAIELTWAASTAESVSGYEVWRGTTSGSLSLLASSSTMTSYIDNTANACTAYYYAVHAKVGSFASNFSNETSATIALVPSITVVSPNGGENWQVGTSHLITWVSTSCTMPSNVAIEYSTNNGVNWSTIGTTANTGSYLWAVGNTPASQVLVRVSGDGLTDTSNAVFSLTPIPAPSNLVATSASSTVGLVWTASTARNLSGYEVWRGSTLDSLSLLTSVSSTTNSYTDNNVTNCSVYVYAVRAMVSVYASSFSNTATAAPAIIPTITVTAPNSAEVWHSGQVQMITWTSTSCTVPSNVTLEYSTNNGGNWSTIATIVNSSSYSWTIPNTPTTQAKVRVSGGTMNDMSDAVFTILPAPVPVVTAVQSSVTTSSCSGTASGMMVSITLSDPIYPVGSLILNATSSNQSVVSNGSIVRQGATSATTTFLVTANATTSGVSVLTFTASNGFAVSSTTVTFTSTVNALPAVIVSGSTSACATGMGIYNIPPTTGASYRWTVEGGTIVSGQNTREINVEWGSSGNGSVAVVATSASSCITSASMSVSINPLPVATIIVDGETTFCPGNSVMLTASPSGMSYLWSNGSTERSILVGESGAYSVSVTNQFGCSAMSTTTTVMVYAGVAVEASTDMTVCQGSTVQLQASATSPVGGITYRWSPSTGLNSTTTAVVTASPSTTTTYTVIVRDANGCESSDQVTVTVVPASAITLSSDTAICAGASAVLTATGGVSYNWSPSVGLSGTTTAAVVASPSTTTTYTVEIETASGCVVSRLVTVTVAPVATADAGSDINLCAGSSIQLAATGGVSYKWSPATGLDNAFIANPVASPSTTTTYTVLIRTAAGCESSDQVTVTVLPLVVNLHVQLEGAYTGSGMSTSLRSQDLIPTNQPYNVAPFNYAGTEMLATTSTAVVDWVLVEVRTGIASNTTFMRKAALLLEDGSIVESNGESLQFVGLTGHGTYYIVLRHRNHLGIMSATAAGANSMCEVMHNFTGSTTSVYEVFMPAQKELAPGVWGMISGDADANGIVNAGDRVMVRNASGELGYRLEDLSLDGIVNAVDRVISRNNVFKTSQVP